MEDFHQRIEDEESLDFIEKGGHGVNQSVKTWMAINGILILVMLGTIVGLLPMWPYARRWGYIPSGFLSFSLLVFIGLLLAGVF